MCGVGAVGFIAVPVNAPQITALGQHARDRCRHLGEDQDIDLMFAEGSVVDLKICLAQGAEVGKIGWDARVAE